MPVIKPFANGIDSIRMLGKTNPDFRLVMNCLNYSRIVRSFLNLDGLLTIER